MKGKNIDLTNDQYTQLQDLIQYAYRSNYYYDNNTDLIDELYEASNIVCSAMNEACISIQVA